MREWYIKDQKAKNDYLDWYFGSLYDRLKPINDHLMNNKREFMVGDAITLADYSIMEFAQRVLLHKNWSQRCEASLDKCPELKDYLKRRMNDEGFLAYLETRVTH